MVVVGHDGGVMVVWWGSGGGHGGGVVVVEFRTLIRGELSDLCAGVELTVGCGEGCVTVA